MFSFLVYNIIFKQIKLILQQQHTQKTNKHNNKSLVNWLLMKHPKPQSLLIFCLLLNKQNRVWSILCYVLMYGPLKCNVLTMWDQNYAPFFPTIHVWYVWRVFSKSNSLYIKKKSCLFIKISLRMYSYTLIPNSFIKKYREIPVVNVIKC